MESNIFFFVWILDYYFAGVFDYAGNTPITEYRMAKYSNGIWTEVQEVINAQVLCGNHSILYYSAIYPGGGQVFPIGAIDTLSNETIFSYVPKLAGGVNDPNMVLAIYVYENLVFYSGTFAIQLSGSTTASSGKFFLFQLLPFVLFSSQQFLKWFIMTGSHKSGMALGFLLFPSRSRSFVCLRSVSMSLMALGI